jgi:hypothetical protein
MKPLNNSPIDHAYITLSVDYSKMGINNLKTDNKKEHGMHLSGLHPVHYQER